jgi:Tol biopolymer transport system component
MVDGALTRVSVTSGGLEQPGESWDASISDDGSHIAFTSSARLASGDSAVYRDVFMRNRDTLRTVLVSKSHTGGAADRDSQFAVMSPNSDCVAYASRASNLVDGDVNDKWDVFLYNTGNSTNRLVSVSSTEEQGNGNSAAFDAPAVSKDGLIVAFTSFASNLVFGDDNSQPDIFVRDVLEGTTSLVSRDSAGNQGNGESGVPSISHDGRIVAFQSMASNLVPDDTNGVTDIFVHDRSTGTTTRVSVSSTGEQANNHCLAPAISANGRYVVFHTQADNLVGDDNNAALDVFIHDRSSRVTKLVSANTQGEVGDGHSELAAVSADARYVAFQSRATDLIADDRNTAQDVFMRDLGPDPAALVPILESILHD